MSEVPFDLTGVDHHPVVEEIVDVICNKTQNTDRGFFRTEVAFFLGKMAGCMRATVSTKDRGEIPINIYTVALAESGYGKGHSMNILEQEFCQDFKNRFMHRTMPTLADRNIQKVGTDIALAKGGDPAEEIENLARFYHKAGEYPFTFDSGTAPAVKQLREKLILAGCGSINLSIDEIGSNLMGNTDILNVYLELYDQGLVKQKLVKNTADNVRTKDLTGKTPANMMLFGTPTSLMNGGQTEEQFYAFLETGYARRCLFSLGQKDQKAYNSLTPEEIYRNLLKPQNNTTVSKWANHFDNLADLTMFNWTMTVEDEVGIKLLEYKLLCERVADDLPTHEPIKKAELSHRYFKALKLAGAYAFVDKSMEVTMDHLLQAIKLVEESGKAFTKILHREKPYVKLAKYIAAVDTEVTHADLHEALPFYKSSQAARSEMLTLATAWGYKNNILIQESFIDGIEFFSGSSLEETDLEKLKVSYSTDFATDYVLEEAPFSDIQKLTQADGLHWCNHGFLEGHRSEDNVIAGFNMVVVDVDGGVSIESAKELLEDYTYHIYTTKRHTEEENRFRVVLPIKYVLTMDSVEYKQFINNVLEWLPFESDQSSNQRSKKWLSHDGTWFSNEGELLDPVQFIPRTSKNEAYQKTNSGIADINNFDRWFARIISTGNRNNTLIRYALALMDSGLSLIEIGNRVHGLNKRIAHPLTPDEIDSTIMKTVAKHMSQ